MSGEQTCLVCLMAGYSRALAAEAALGPLMRGPCGSRVPHSPSVGHPFLPLLFSGLHGTAEDHATCMRQSSEQPWPRGSSCSLGGLSTLPRQSCPPLHLRAAELLGSRVFVLVLPSCPQRKWCWGLRPQVPPKVAQCWLAASVVGCLCDTPHGLCRS